MLVIGSHCIRMFKYLFMYCVTFLKGVISKSFFFVVSNSIFIGLNIKYKPYLLISK